MAEIIEYIAIKSYTDIEQSKKLAKILPIESADMWHHGFFHPLRMCKIEYNPPAPYHSVNSQWDCPCWSLAALLDVLHDYILQTNTDGTVFVFCESKKPMISDAYDNPVDACYEMILELHKLKML